MWFLKVQKGSRAVVLWYLISQEWHVESWPAAFLVLIRLSVWVRKI